MAKSGSKGGKASGGSWSKRSGSTGAFVIGRASFGSISAVEGIKLSRSMAGEFRRTEGMPADKRRAALSSKYGKKK